MKNKFNKINKLFKSLRRQRGAALLLMMVVIVAAASAILVTSLSSAGLLQERDKITADALAKAKEALLGYAMIHGDPGELPCPDTNNDGQTETSCGNGSGSTGQTLRIGRLPWKTLGLPDLRDGSGERLWYAVSSNFKYHFRFYPLNSDTPGTISVRAQDGTLINDGSSISGGAVALVIAPGVPLQRTDKTSMQNRSASGQNLPENYLEIANGEDNANFTDGSATDGFIQGSIKDVNGNFILNDRIMVITRETMLVAMQHRVLNEVVNSLNAYFAIHNNFPQPSDFSDSSCLGTSSLAPPPPMPPLPTPCQSSSTQYSGRIPANPSPAWAPSTLNGASSNWFQSNGWRELIYYTVSPTCVTSTCSTGILTLNKPPASPAANQKIVVIATGNALAGQSRSGMGMPLPQNVLSNYLEGENLTTGDNTYSTSGSSPFNDMAVGVP